MVQYQSFPGAAGDSRTLDKLKALRLPDLSGKKFLDVGCNEGFFCGFARFQGAASAVGIDYSEKFIARARARFSDCQFMHRGWDNLPDDTFDVILLASALHYADDQPALIRSLIKKLSLDGVLVLELGIVSSDTPEWRRVKRGIDERLFPSMPMLKQILADYAWKWMGPSVSQQGDPVGRHVLHISRRRPVAYLLMQPPGYGKSSIATGLFTPAGVPVISGDQKVGRIGGGTGEGEVSEALRAMIAQDYSPFHIDQITRSIFDRGLGSDLVDVWLDGAGADDVALDVYVPAEYYETVERLLDSRGYLPVRLSWERVGEPPLPDELAAQQAEQFYLSMLDPAANTDGTSRPAVTFEPTGFVDEILVENGRLILRGWAINVDGGLPAQIEVKLGRRSLQVESVERQLRPDVQRHMGLPHALVGYRLSLVAPPVRNAADLEGIYVHVPGGARFSLAAGADTIVRGTLSR